MDPRADKLIRRTTMAGTCVAAYLLVTADFSPQPNALDPVKRAIRSAESYLKSFLPGTPGRAQETGKEKPED